MDKCRLCGATLAPDLGWCGRCFTPRPTPSQPVAERTTLQNAMRDRAAGTAVVHAEFSRWRGGPTSYGPLGRTLLTLAVLIGLVIGEPLMRGLMVATVGFDPSGSGFMVFYAVLAVPVCAYLIVVRIWKRVRIA